MNNHDNHNIATVRFRLICAKNHGQSSLLPNPIATVPMDDLALTLTSRRCLAPLQKISSDNLHAIAGTDFFDNVVLTALHLLSNFNL